MTKTKLFYCNTCNSGFDRRFNYDHHLKSKKHKLLITNPINFHVCSHCKKKFAFYSGLYKHGLKCKVINDIDKTDILEKENLELHKKNLELTKKVEDLEKSKITTNIGTQIVENQQNNIIINCFGNENLDYITDKVILHCMEKIYGSIPLLIEKIHFDPEHPENHNVFIPNKKLSHAKIMNHKREWQIVQKKNVIHNMMDIGYSILDEKFQEKGHELTDFKQKRFRDFQDQYIDGNKKTQNDIRTNIENVIINSKPNII
jgi:hypothetical protein